MKKTMDEINKMIMEDAPMNEVEDAKLADKVKRLIFSDKGVIC